MKAVSTLAVLALSAIPSVAATPAPQDLVTHCVGQGGAVTVPGDLLVPAGQTCSLTGTVVAGDVLVEPGANLLVQDGTFEAGVTVAADGYLDAVDTSFGGAVTNDSAYGAYLVSSVVSGAYRATGAAEGGPFLVAEDVAFEGLVRTTGGSLDLLSSTVSGDVRGDNGEFTDVHDTVITGDLRVRGNLHGSQVCASEVDGLGQIINNGGPVQIGGDGQLGTCAGPGYWGGTLQVAKNTGGVEVNDNIVRADLVGNGNDPAPLGADNRVRGAHRGQFADLQPGHAASPSFGATDPGSVRDDLERDRAARAAQAHRQAERLGAAQL